MTHIITPPIIGKTDPPEFVAYEETMLREPRLLVPGMQPLRQMKVDWTNPLTRDLRSFVIPGNSDAVSGILMSIPPTSLLNRPLGKASMGPNRSYWATANKTSLAKSYSMFSCYSSTNNGQVTASFYQIYVSSINYVLLQSAWSAPDLQTRFSEAGSSYNAMAGIGKRPTDRFTIYGVTVTDNADVTHYYNGKSYSTGNDARTIINGSGNTYLGTDGGTGIHIDYSIYAGIFWQRALSPEEVAAFSNDPYQFLIPA